MKPTILYSTKKLCRLITSVSAMALLTGASVSAQTSSDETSDDIEGLEEIVITGSFIRTLSRSLDEKRYADNVADAIVASDIGKLPAVNIAEALQRVPGITIVREAGEGQFISARGLGPNFQAVTLNGMPMAYNENVRTSGQSGRQFRLRVLPADLIGGIVVNKTSSADLIEGGIGSNVDIKIIDPLESDTFVAARAFASYEERSDKITPNGSLSGVWKNDDGTFGVIGGISYSLREVQFDRYQNEGWSTEHGIAELEGVSVPGNMRLTLEQEKRERLSALAGVQWAPSESMELKVHALYSQFNNEIAERRLTFEQNGNWDTLDLDTARVIDDRLIEGTQNARIRNTTEFSDQAHENLIISGSARFIVAGWSVEPKLSYSEATSGLDTPLQRIEYRNSAEDGTISFGLGENPVGDASIDFLTSSLDLTDPATVPFRRYRIRSMDSKDEDITAGLDISRELEARFGGLDFTGFKAGFQYSDRSRDYQRRDRSNLVLRDGVELTDAFNALLVPSNAFDLSTNEVLGWTSADWDLFRDSYIVDGEFDGVEPSSYDLEPTAADLRNSYGVDENITAAYARLDFTSEVGSVPFSGNIGLRYVVTDSVVQGTQAVAEADSNGDIITVTEPATFENTYKEWLPSLNLNFELNDSMLLRFAVSKTMTRPSLSELRSSLNTNSSTLSEIFDRGAEALNDPNNPLDLTASGGNPNLSPYYSWNFDLSYEWYFEEFGAFTVAAFYKDVSDYIASDFETRTLPFAVNDGSTLPVEILVSTPANVGDVEIKGVEFGYTNKWDNGLGITATATFSSSDLTLSSPDIGVETAVIQGISDVAFSITPFFELGRFEANISYTYRSDYLAGAGVDVTSRPELENTVLRYQNGFGTLDVGASYDLTDNVEIFLQAVNMLGERPTTYQENEDQVHQIHTYGRTINFGVRAKF